MQIDADQRSAQAATLPASQSNPWDPGAKAAQQAYVQDRNASSTGYTSPYRSAPSNKQPFSDVKTDPNISFSVGTFGRFQMNYNTGSF